MDPDFECVEVHLSCHSVPDTFPEPVGLPVLGEDNFAALDHFVEVNVLGTQTEAIVVEYVCETEEEHEGAIRFAFDGEVDVGVENALVARVNLGGKGEVSAQDFDASLLGDSRHVGFGSVLGHHPS